MNYVIILVVVLIICLLYFVVVYNKLIKLNNSVNESFATMDVYLKKRWDLIPNLVEIVKGYAKHEKDTFKEVVKLRNGNYDDLSNDDKIKANEKLSKGISKIIPPIKTSKIVIASHPKRKNFTIPAKHPDTSIFLAIIISPLHFVFLLH